MNYVLVLLFSAGGAAFLSALVSGVRAIGAHRAEYDARPIVPMIIQDSPSARLPRKEQIRLAEQYLDHSLAGTAKTLQRPYAGKIHTSFDYVYDQEVLSTSWDIATNATEEEQAQLRQQIEDSLRADGTGVLVTDKITWSKNSAGRGDLDTTTAPVRRGK